MECKRCDPLIVADRTDHCYLRLLHRMILIDIYEIKKVFQLRETFFAVDEIYLR